MFPQRISLVGLMGAGKTTVGRKLAQRVGYEFLDLDHEIERRTGVRVPVIFELEGESGFRDREATLLREVAQRTQLVLATGGGTVIREENRAALRAAGFVIYLHAKPNLLFERTRNDRNRPLLDVNDPLARLEELYAFRDPLYREVANVVIQSHGGSAGGIVRQIMSELGKCAN